jgi:hypothetical protein
MDVGTDIQDVLSGIDPSIASSVCRAMFVSQGPYDLYMLGIPSSSTPVIDTLCVYDMRTKKWFIWKISNLVRALLFNIAADGTPQWLMGGQINLSGVLGTLFQFDSTSIQDVNTTPEVTVRTSWLDFENPSSFKILDELEAYVSEIDNTFLTIEAADRLPQFNAPIPIVTGKAFRLGPFGTFKAYLATLPTHHRYFRFTFFSPENGLSTLPSDFLNGYLVRYQLVNAF